MSTGIRQLLAYRILVFFYLKRLGFCCFFEYKLLAIWWSTVSYRNHNKFALFILEYSRRKI